MPRLRLGQLLVDAKLITAEALDEVLAVQRSDGRRLGTLLVERGLINETQLTQILSHQLSVPWVSLLHIEFSRQLLNLVPHDVADRYCLVPIYVRHVRNQGETLYIAMDDPSNEEGLRACREHSGLPVRSMIAPPADIRNAIRVYYGIEPRAPSALQPSPAARSEAPAARPAVEPEPAATQREPSVRVVVPPPSVPPPAVVVLDAPPVEHAPRAPEPIADGPVIETVEIPIDTSRAERLRAILEQPSSPPSEPPVENIPRPRGRAPRMVSLTLLDGTTLNLPARRRQRPRPADEQEPAEPVSSAPSPAAAPPVSAPTADPPSLDGLQGLTARDLVLALRVVAHGADASEVLGSNVRWESLFASLLSLMLKKHLIADWEFVDELKKNL
ncbi:Type IV fimbrial assembly, ATPase PilB [Minicystis rosea]|nr:Type IV fimbrial assembly, ATPase PilB [Minicystis rosea]